MARDRAEATIADRLYEAVNATLRTPPVGRLGVAVSGGGDSMALLDVMAQVSRDCGASLSTVTVDHGLRSGSKKEAELVSLRCRALGVPHTTLYWTDWDGQGNLQAQARDARYRLISDWAQRQNVGQIYLAHTADDQAETVLMRLARSSGVDGLSAMSERSKRFGIELVRPFLGVRREELRTYLREMDQPWVDDPSNQDASFERIRMREALPVLEALGITTVALAGVAHNMESARHALQRSTYDAAKRLARTEFGSVRIEPHLFFAEPEEIQRRLLIHSLHYIAPSVYAPRRKTVSRALAAMRARKSITLSGCCIQHARGAFWIYREPQAIKTMTAKIGETWDKTWVTAGQGDVTAYQVRALGRAGLAQLDRIEHKNTRLLPVPRQVLRVLPSIWRDDRLIAAPTLVPHADWLVTRHEVSERYLTMLLSH